MSHKKNDLTILLSIYDKCRVPNDSEVLLISELAQCIFDGRYLRMLFRYRTVTLLCPSINMLPWPFMVAAACRLLTLMRVKWVDDYGEKTIHWITLLPMFVIYVRDQIIKKKYIRDKSDELLSLFDAPDITDSIDVKNLYPAYVRTDEPCHLNAGGSVGHIAGVINNMEKVINRKPIFITTEKIPTVGTDVPTILIRNTIPYRNIRFINPIAYNDVCYADICSALDKGKVNIIYHRYSLGSYSAVRYAILNGIHYILEYNGSELWVLKNWSQDSMSAKQPYFKLLYEIENTVLSRATLIVCVSTPLKDQLVEMGIPESRILVNPNGVDIERYSPTIDGSGIRNRYGISMNDIVIGFIGTFGAWHGAERLALAYSKLSAIYDNIHLLMIGDGPKMEDVEANLSKVHQDRYTLAGMVPQDEGPKFLAACDILVSPTIPNPDGSPFFGSPTKTFEYMAMGKAIVVSDMDQMSEIFDDGITALMCTPGNDEELEKCISKLIDDEFLRSCLGSNARKEAVENHTWKKHTEKIFEALDKL